VLLSILTKNRVKDSIEILKDLIKLIKGLIVREINFWESILMSIEKK
jgi:hypothetical protein